MTALDDKLVPVAFNLIDKFGFEVLFKEFVEPIYDPATGEVFNKPTEINNNSQAQTDEHLWKISPPFPQKANYSEDNNSEVAQLSSFTAAQGIQFTPKKGMHVIMDGETWTISEVNTIRSGELVAVYELLWRQ